MNKYEMLYVLDMDLSEEARESIIKKVEDLVTGAGGTVESTDRWGMKKLQYPINYKSEGFYVLMTFETAPAVIVEIERVASITDGIVRRMITKR